MCFIVLRKNVSKKCVGILQSCRYITHKTSGSHDDLIDLFKFVSSDGCHTANLPTCKLKHLKEGRRLKFFLEFPVLPDVSFVEAEKSRDRFIQCLKRPLSLRRLCAFCLTSWGQGVAHSHIKNMQTIYVKSGFSANALQKCKLIIKPVTLLNLLSSFYKAE
jgi:hypothetical protein